MEDEENMNTHERERKNTITRTSHHTNTTTKTEHEDTLLFWSIIPRHGTALLFLQHFASGCSFEHYIPRMDIGTLHNNWRCFFGKTLGSGIGMYSLHPGID